MVLYGLAATYRFRSRKARIVMEAPAAAASPAVGGYAAGYQGNPGSEPDGPMADAQEVEQPARVVLLHLVEELVLVTTNGIVTGTNVDDEEIPFVLGFDFVADIALADLASAERYVVRYLVLVERPVVHADLKPTPVIYTDDPLCMLSRIRYALGISLQGSLILGSRGSGFRYNITCCLAPRTIEVYGRSLNDYLLLWERGHRSRRMRGAITSPYM